MLDMQFCRDFLHAPANFRGVGLLKLERRGDVLKHRHRRVIDELLINHCKVALAHTDACHVLTVYEHAARTWPVQSRHDAH